MADPVEQRGAAGKLISSDAGPAENPVAQTSHGIMMSARSVYLFGWTPSQLRRTLGYCISGLVLLVFLYYVQSVLPPFLIAFFLAALLDPSLRYLEKNGKWIHTRTQGVLAYYLIALLILLGIIFFASCSCFENCRCNCPCGRNHFCRTAGSLCFHRYASQRACCFIESLSNCSGIFKNSTCTLENRCHLLIEQRIHIV